MKKPNAKKNIWMVCLLTALAGIIVWCPANAQETKRVAVVPFKINAAQDYSFLREGIYDMLASRLSWGEKVFVVDREKTENALKSFSGSFDEKDARQLASRLDSDYVLFGSVTVLAESVSIDAKMIDVSEKSVPVYLNQIQPLSNVIPEINRFAESVNQKIFGRTESTDVAQKETRVEKPDIHTHPERLFENELNKGDRIENLADTGQKAVSEGKSLNPSFIQAEKAEKGRHGRDFWKSKTFKHLLNGIAVGDVDGDKKKETVVGTEHDILIFRGESGRFYQVKKIEESSLHHIIGVDTGDINGNGIDEIFITRLNVHRNTFTSLIFEYEGGNFKAVSRETSFCYRVIRHAGKSDVLLGQSKKGGSFDLFSGPIYEMNWTGSGYEPGKELLADDQANLIGVAMGDITGKGGNNFLAYTKNDDLRIIEPPENVLWKGNTSHGGSTLYYLDRKIDPDRDNKKYLPMRVILADLDQNGIQEAITANNREMLSKILQQFRKFNKSYIESLSWDGIGLSTNWKTREISGAIRDLAIDDFDNDGVKEIVAAVIIKESTTIGFDSQSTIIAYDLDLK